MVKRLNLGCGDDIKEGFDNVDVQKDKKLTKSFNFNKFPYPIKEESYDYILVKQVLEHLENPERVLIELHRICKPGAIIRIEVPYYNNKGAFGSMQHMHYFSDQTFMDFVEGRKVINKKQSFEIKKLELTPSIIGRLMPKKLREKLSLFIGGLISQVHIELKVIKSN